jgi:hypothetical protein
VDPSRLLFLTGTVTHRTTNTTVVDEMGDPTTTTTSAEWKCWIEQVQRSEQTINTDVQQSRWRLYLELAADGQVAGGDAIEVQGVAYEFDGPPWPAFNPRTRQVTHLEADVRRTT